MNLLIVILGIFMLVGGAFIFIASAMPVYGGRRRSETTAGFLLGTFIAALGVGLVFYAGTRM